MQGVTPIGPTSHIAFRCYTNIRLFLKATIMWGALFLAIAVGLGIFVWDFYDREVPEATRAIRNDMPSDTGSPGKPVLQGTAFDQDGLGTLRLRLFTKTQVEYAPGKFTQPEFRLLCYKGGLYAYLYLGVAPTATTDWLQFNGGDAWTATQDGGYQAANGAALLPWLTANTKKAVPVKVLTTAGVWPDLLFDDPTIETVLPRFTGCSS